MKKIFIILSMGLCLAVSSCKKDDNSSSSNTSNQSISATVSGMAFSSTGSGISESTLSTGSGYYYIYSYGFTATSGNTALIMELPGVAAGTYAYGTGTYYASLEYNTGKVGGVYYSNKNGVPISGGIVITSVGASSITGTFSGTLYTSNGADSVVVANGKFSNLVY